MAITWRYINTSGKWYQAKLALHGALCVAWSFDIFTFLPAQFLSYWMCLVKFFIGGCFLI